MRLTHAEGDGDSPEFPPTFVPVLEAPTFGVVTCGDERETREVREVRERVGVRVCKSVCVCGGRGAQGGEST